MRDGVPVRKSFGAAASDSYLARYFTGEAAVRNAAGQVRILRPQHKSMHTNFCVSSYLVCRLLLVSSRAKPRDPESFSTPADAPPTTTQPPQL
jgi:hypothetical protein